MRLNNRKGMTAMVDAMIFIVVMGLAVSAMFAFSGDELETNDAVGISDMIFSSKIRTDDIMDTDDSRLVDMPDIAAFCLLTGSEELTDYIKSILDSLTQRPGSYFMEIGYRGSKVAIGNPDGTAVSCSVKGYAVTYGDSLSVDLRFY